MAGSSFESAVKGWSQKTEVQQTAVLHEALRQLDDTLVEKTPTKSGNLRKSRTLTTGGPPTVDWKVKKFREPSDAINNAIAGVEVGQTAWLGFRAPYAHKIEPKYAMIRLTAQMWAQIVDAAARVVSGRGA